MAVRPEATLYIIEAGAERQRRLADQCRQLLRQHLGLFRQLGLVPESSS